MRRGFRRVRAGLGFGSASLRSTGATRRPVGVFAMAAALLLAGCASIPSTGAVQQGITLDNSSQVQVDILARGPQDGDTQQQILDGFLAAAASPQLDYQIAREFLTADFSKQWKPDAATTVDQADQRSVSTTSDSSIALRIKPAATISDQGIYSAAISSAAETRNYSFTQVDGQWRISTAPQGIVIDQPTFGVVWSSYNLEFLSPDSSYLVPDVRWFARRETTQTAIVRALVTGPADWLAAGVSTGVPSGARLDADTVPVSNGVAVVNLAVDTVPNIDALARIQTQLLSSLTGVGGITQVSLEINGIVQNVSPMQPAPISTPKVDTRPVVLNANGFGYLSSVSGQLESIAPLAAGVAALSPSAVTIGLNGQFAAVTSGSGVYRVSSNGTSQIVTGGGWTAPSADPNGGIWVAHASGKVTWQGADGGSAEFATGWGSDTVTAIAVSRDGTRIAGLLQSGSVVRLVVSAIARGGDGSPTSIGTPLVVTETDGSAVSGGAALAWLDPSTLGMLSSDSELSMTSAVVGGLATSMAAPNASVTIAGGNSVRDVRVNTSAGEMLLLQSGTWQSRSTGVQVLAQQTGLR